MGISYINLPAEIVVWGGPMIKATCRTHPYFSTAMAPRNCKFGTTANSPARVQVFLNTVDYVLVVVVFVGVAHKDDVVVAVIVFFFIVVVILVLWAILSQ